MIVPRSAYLIRPPKVYRWLFSEALFRMSENEKKVYLTFDDGPHPEATRFVLDVLKKHDVEATFFLLGKNAKQHPELVAEIKTLGHAIGNHGMDHLNGWNTNLDEYVSDVEKGKQVLDSKLFRPAYGKLTLSQYRRLRETEQIVFWDVISGDFDQKIDERTVLNNVLKNVRNGSIIVMHDSKKAMKNLFGSMNEIIVELKQKGFCFGTLSPISEP
ncbi:MAG: polysaccharide deacetylase family protein [Flavobacteriales bacterium]|nr:polysaccharide deacetylase family protein [Flavobacteriales bacterium]